MSTCEHTRIVHQRYESIADEAILLHDNKTSWVEISRIFHVDKDCLIKYLINTGRYKAKIRKVSPTYSSQIMCEAKERYQNGESVSQIAKDLQVNRKTLAKDLKRFMNVDILHDGKKKINDYYFHEINTKDKAYWLGFLYADGYVKDEALEFCLQDADKESVEEFKKALDSKHKISRKISCLDGKMFVNWRISIKSQQITEDLISHGCIPLKTYHMVFPNDIEEDLMSHFIRGYTDGDGCLYISRGALHVSYTSASKIFLEGLQAFLKSKDIRSSLYKVKNKENWGLSLSGRNAKSLCEFLYRESNDSIRLKRKYEKYLSYLQLLPSRDKDCEKSLDDKGGIKLEGHIA